MDSPISDFAIRTFSPYKFLETTYQMMNIKFHLHHPHVTGRVYEYAHYFCKWKVRENQIGFSCLAHNIFGFDTYFFIKGIQLSVWETKISI